MTVITGIDTASWLHRAALFSRLCRLALFAATWFLSAEVGRGQVRYQLFEVEEETVRVRDPRDLPRVPLPRVGPPTTVTRRRVDVRPTPLSLNETIRVALANAEVVRFIGGQTASNSGRTIYDAAISNTSIDREKARFDPTFNLQNSFNRTENAGAIIDPSDPLRAILSGLRTDDYRVNAGFSRTSRTGGAAAMNFAASPTRVHSGNGPLNPQSGSSAELSWTQPWMQGAGRAANEAPIVVARINTERSYFQYKDSVQELVRGAIEGYWNIVGARVDVWARRQQITQAEAALARAESRFKNGVANIAEPSQARVALTGFQASLVTAEATLLNRESALRSLLGMPPLDQSELIPYTSPIRERLEINWEELVDLAEVNRPDLIELKLILEADTQLLGQARNQAQPRLDTTLRYRWNGLEGEMLDGSRLRSRGGQYTDWTMAVNFSVPFGLRQDRASLRQQQLNIARDRANLQQALHQITHELALSMRNLDQFFAQYRAFQATREAAEINLGQQLTLYGNGRAILVDVLLAITNYGNAVSNEAQAVVQYNSALATLERQTGTILESHGVFFFEERFTSIGPKGRFEPPRHYPHSHVPKGPANRYENGQRPAEEVFDLKPPQIRRPIEIPRWELLPPPAR